jgi:hypothetical protein
METCVLRGIEDKGHGFWDAVSIPQARRYLNLTKTKLFQSFQTFNLIRSCSKGLSAFKAFNGYAQFKSFKTSEV